jgi:hypothetical protein
MIALTKSTETRKRNFIVMIDHAQKEHDLRHEDLTPKLKEQIRDLIILDD